MKYPSLKDFFKDLPNLSNLEIQRQIYKYSNNLDFNLLVTLQDDFVTYFQEDVCKSEEYVKIIKKDESKLIKNLEERGEYVPRFIEIEYQGIDDNLIFRTKLSIKLSRDNLNIEDYNELITIMYNFYDPFMSIVESYNKKLQKIQKIDDDKFDIEVSDSKAIDKILYLHKLGIIDFLRGQQPFISVPDKVSQVLSVITGINIDSIRPMVRPMVNNDLSNSKNPLNSKKAVDRVEKQLINIGFNLNETN
jgi:hypothetical protein